MHRRALDTTSCRIFNLVTRQFQTPVVGELPNYSQRIVYCRNCNTPNDATSIQLWYKKGFRTLHCRGCKTYFSAYHALCACGHVWHSCPTHRMDPLAHVPRRGWKRKRAQPRSLPAQETVSYPHRQAPELPQSEPWNLQNHLPKRRVVLQPSIAPTLARRFPHLVQTQCETLPTSATCAAS